MQMQLEDTTRTTRQPGDTTAPATLPAGPADISEAELGVNVSSTTMNKQDQMAVPSQANLTPTKGQDMQISHERIAESKSGGISTFKNKAPDVTKTPSEIM